MSTKIFQETFIKYCENESFIGKNNKLKVRTLEIGFYFIYIYVAIVILHY
ncbi:hypothetical protein [Clostridium saccharoperbutylacetonicum]